MEFNPPLVRPISRPYPLLNREARRRPMGLRMGRVGPGLPETASPLRTRHPLTRRNAGSLPFQLRLRRRIKAALAPFHDVVPRVAIHAFLHPRDMLIQGPDDPGRIARDHGIGRHVLTDDRPGPDDRARADGHARQDGRTAAD